MSKETEKSIQELMSKNMLTNDVLVVGKDIDILLNNFESYSLTTYGIEYNSVLFRKGMEGKHLIMHGPITSDVIKNFKRGCFDIIYVNNIKCCINNFDLFFSTIKQFMHQHSNLYINIIGLNKEYFYTLQEDLRKHGMKLVKVTTHVKINLKND